MRYIKILSFSVLILTLSCTQVAAQWNAVKNLFNKDAVESLTTTLTQKKTITLADLVGSWKYAKPAFEFQSDDLLKQAGGSMVSSQIEEKLSSTYTKLGMTAELFSFVFNADSTFTCQLKTLKTQGKVVAVNAEKRTVTLQYTSSDKLLNIGKVDVSVRRAGDQLCLLYNADKLLTLLSTISSASNNSTLSTIGKLAGSYQGLLIGYEMEKK